MERSAGRRVRPAWVYAAEGLLVVVLVSAVLVWTSHVEWSSFVAGGAAGWWSHVVSRPHRRAVSPGAATDGWSAVDLELERSRRSERPFAILRLDDESCRRSQADELEDDRPPALRAVDVVWQESSEHYVLLPDTDGLRARDVLGRLQRRHVSGRSAGIAVFPDDGLTSGALRAAVRAPRVPAPRAVDGVPVQRADGVASRPDVTVRRSDSVERR